MTRLWLDWLPSSEGVVCSSPAGHYACSHISKIGKFVRWGRKTPPPPNELHSVGAVLQPVDDEESLIVATGNRDKTVTLAVAPFALATRGDQAPALSLRKTKTGQQATGLLLLK